MAKGVVIYTILTTAFVSLTLLPPSSKSYKGNRHIRLFEGTNFDPLVTKYEHNSEQKWWNDIHNYDGLHPHDDHTSIYYVHDGLMEEEEEEEEEKANMVYFEKDGKLNLTLRLITLFPMIDNLPKDGYVEFRELEAWNVMQAKERLEYSTRRELEVLDINKDGLISINEFFPHFLQEDIDIEKMKMGHGETGWWMEQFANADFDQDGKLNLQELKDFLHPEESTKNTKVQDWFLREKIRRLGWNKDVKLNFREFRDNVYDTFRVYYQFSSGNANVSSPELQFSILDLNKDGFLTIQDLKPIKKFLFPGVLDNASYYATYLMNEVDDNQDDKLTLDEILNHEDKFYKSVYVGDEEDDGESDHDEF